MQMRIRTRTRTSWVDSEMLVRLPCERALELGSPGYRRPIGHFGLHAPRQMRGRLLGRLQAGQVLAPRLVAMDHHRIRSLDWQIRPPKARPHLRLVDGHPARPL